MIMAGASCSSTPRAATPAPASSLDNRDADSLEKCWFEVLPEPLQAERLHGLRNLGMPRDRVLNPLPNV